MVFEQLPLAKCYFSDYPLIETLMNLGQKTRPPGSSIGEWGVRAEEGSLLMELLTFFQVLLFPGRRLGGQRPLRRNWWPPLGLEMTHQPQGMGPGLGVRPAGLGPRPVV